MPRRALYAGSAHGAGGWRRAARGRGARRGIARATSTGVGRRGPWRGATG